MLARHAQYFKAIPQLNSNQTAILDIRLSNKDRLQPLQNLKLIPVTIRLNLIEPAFPPRTHIMNPSWNPMVVPISLPPARFPAVTYRIRRAEAAVVAEAEESMALHTCVVRSAGVAVEIVSTDFSEDPF